MSQRVNVVEESSGPKLNLVVQSGKFKGQRYPLFEGMVIGRGEQAHLYLPDFKASRRHAILHEGADGFELEDLKSHNGTFLNGDRITRVPVAAGDVIHIGSTRLEVQTELPLAVQNTVSGEFPEDSGLTPTIVRRVEMLTPPTLQQMQTDEYFTALGLPEPGKDPRDFDGDAFRKVLTKTRNFAIVYEISKVLASAVEVDELLKTAIDFILNVVSADRGYIIMRDPSTGELRRGASRRRTEDMLALRRGQEFEDAPLEISKSIIDWVVRERSAAVSSDAASDQRFQDRQSVVLYNIRSVLCAPMIHGEDVKGCIQLDSLGGGVGFSEEDLELISTIAPVLAVAVENTRLIEAQKATIAELREAHEKLVQAQQRLVEKEKMAIVGRFTGGLAHEIRNLMGPFMLADLLVAEYPDDEQIQECSTLMLEAYTRIGSLVEEIRLLARGEQSDLTVRQHDLESTLAAVIRLVKCDHQVRRHRIILDVASELPAMKYDENRLKQVFINLIRNGVQAMEESGDLTVRAFARDDGKVTIQVADQGSGIPEEVVGRIFEPFFSTKAAEGTGLGLDVCWRIVESHGGTIECESKVGEGTTMSVIIPADCTP